MSSGYAYIFQQVTDRLKLNHDLIHHRQGGLRIRIAIGDKEPAERVAGYYRRQGYNAYVTAAFEYCSLHISKNRSL